MNPINAPSELLGGIVVFYFPETEFINKIESYVNEIDSLLVYDNSERPSEVVHSILKERYGNRITIFSDSENRGIGCALNTGIAWAQKNDYQWLLTMDQDSSFQDRTFFEEFKRYPAKEDVAIFSPNQVSPLTDITKPSEVAEEIIVMTSGNLVNLNLNKVIGPFTEKLFIDEIDHDYCLRARKIGFKILSFKNIRLNHSLGRTLKIRKGKNEYLTTEHSAFRIYYITRNNLYIFKKYIFRFPKFVSRRMLNLLMIFKDIAMYQQDKKTKFVYILRGIQHFIMGRYGKL